MPTTVVHAFCSATTPVVFSAVSAVFEELRLIVELKSLRDHPSPLQHSLVRQATSASAPPLRMQSSPSSAKQSRQISLQQQLQSTPSQLHFSRTPPPPTLQLPDSPHKH